MDRSSNLPLSRLLIKVVHETGMKLLLPSVLVVMANKVNVRDGYLHFALQTYTVVLQISHAINKIVILKFLENLSFWVDFKLKVPYTKFGSVFQNLVGLVFSCVKQDLLNLFQNKLLKFKQIDNKMYSIRVLKFNYFLTSKKYCIL